ncbi:uncharacterized protein LOC8070145 isoform X1 [Sorghum bicolor]|uniref:F-box domain-containing protein n=1 Tax=Sorghum bicolor TaxID=4558 RepID=A0A1Z5R811_SORBI|nr:uncharacterized protein LOC8070145 isoform X1 [Sorghum bicolor]XP_021302086.1 uncharacterized protein LOC8070145 isoform X1 [Sorghum bicolor]OQU79580.1 hypothetical protein SORBI_3008G165200 [Sorghum bicolor]OQU79581.1 hypothetical protein SORBI_3008G165200 [Sorghum bicolor]|eukprot:XP_002443529.1 uncharacterized protein LOC8070145 isoform X1 [Sorghum bicolor]
MSSPPAHSVACAPASQPVFPDEILEEIFLRLDAAEDLARASAACTAFHRVVSARRFLHRFRCLHPPPVLGFLEFDALGTFRPAEPPHRAAPAARALAQAADFTFSFLGNPYSWHVCDARDSRVLLYRRVRITSVFADLMVCDPLHRRHVELPAIPDDLAAATGGWGMQVFDPFLDPDSDKVKEKQDLSFRVICAVQCRYKLVTFHFSSVTGQWRGITFNRPVPLDATLVWFQGLFERHYAHGCYFWTIGVDTSFMIMLNMHDMELSVVDLPPGIHNSPQALAVVEAGEGMIGLFSISGDMLQLYYKSLQETEWHHQRIIPLPKPNSYWDIFAAAAGYLLLKAKPRDSSQIAKWESQYFTLNLKTFLVERLCVSNFQYTRGALLYASFLSPFSLPSI